MTIFVAHYIRSATMIIAKQKRKENIAEYLLYMWQVEDLIRANNLDIEKIKLNIISKYEQPESVIRDITTWYEELIAMMRIEGISEKGHLQINKIVVTNLTETHLFLLKNQLENIYKAVYFKTLPHIVLLRARSGGEDLPEIETCFNAIYGLLIMRLQGREISNKTTEAIKQISNFLSLLAEKHKAVEDGTLLVED